MFRFVALFIVTFLLCIGGRESFAQLTLPTSLTAEELTPPAPNQLDSAVGLVFSPDGVTLAVVDQAGGIQLWDWKRRYMKKRMTGAYGNTNSPLVYSPDGKLLAAPRAHDRKRTGNGHFEVGIWVVASGKRLSGVTTPPMDYRKFVAQASIESLAFSPDGKYVSSGDRAGFIVEWDAKTGWPTAYREVIEGRRPPPSPSAVMQSQHKTRVVGIDIAGNNKAAASVSSDALFLMRMASRRNARSLPVRDADLVASNGLCFSPDDTTLMVYGGVRTRTAGAGIRRGAGGGVRRPAGKRPPRKPTRPRNTEKAIAAAPRGRILLASVATGRTVGGLNLPQPVTSAVFSPDGGTIVAAQLDGKVHFIDVKTKKTIGVLEAAGVRRLAISPDAKAVAFCGRGAAKLWYLDAAARAASPKVPVAAAVRHIREARRLMKRRKPQRALNHLRTLIRNYPQSDESNEGRKLVQKLIDDFPKSKAAKNSRSFLREINRSKRKKR